MELRALQAPARLPPSRLVDGWVALLHRGVFQREVQGEGLLHLGGDPEVEAVALVDSVLERVEEAGLDDLQEAMVAELRVLRHQQGRFEGPFDPESMLERRPQTGHQDASVLWFGGELLGELPPGFVRRDDRALVLVSEQMGRGPIGLLERYRYPVASVWLPVRRGLRVGYLLWRSWLRDVAALRIYRELGGLPATIGAPLRRSLEPEGWQCRVLCETGDPVAAWETRPTHDKGALRDGLRDYLPWLPDSERVFGLLEKALDPATAAQRQGSELFEALLKRLRWTNWAVRRAPAGGIGGPADYLHGGRVEQWGFDLRPQRLVGAPLLDASALGFRAIHGPFRAVQLDEFSRYTVLPPEPLSYPRPEVPTELMVASRPSCAPQAGVRP